MKVRMKLQRFLDCGVLVGAVVVIDQVQFAPVVTLGQRLREIDEFHMGVAWKATAMDLTTGNLQGGKKTGGAVVHVIMSLAGWQAGPQRQQRLGA
jgi:hypothetical protein